MLTPKQPFRLHYRIRGTTTRQVAFGSFGQPIFYSIPLLKLLSKSLRRGR